MAKHKPTIGRYHTQANPITNKLIDIETDKFKDSKSIKLCKRLEFRIMAFRMFAMNDTATKRKNHPKPLLKQFSIKFCHSKAGKISFFHYKIRKSEKISHLINN